MGQAYAVGHLQGHLGTSDRRAGHLHARPRIHEQRHPGARRQQDACVAGQDRRHADQGRARRHCHHRHHPVFDRDDRHGGRPRQRRRHGPAPRHQRHHGRQHRHHAGQRPDRPAARAAGADPRRHLRAGLRVREERQGPQHRARLHGLRADLLRPEPDDRRPASAAQHAGSDVGALGAEGRQLHEPDLLRPDRGAASRR